MDKELTGGRKTSAVIKARYGDDYYSKIGRIGAKKYRERQKLGIAEPRGFAANRELASRAGKIGGKKSRRGNK